MNTLTDLAKDFTKGAPRSPRVRIGGYIILARMTDKGRAVLNGSGGNYHFDCPIDNLLFSFKGVKGEEVKKLLEWGATDDEVAFWFDHHGTPKTADEIKAWGDSVETMLPYHMPERREAFAAGCVLLGLDPETTTGFDYLEADDRASFKS